MQSPKTLYAALCVGATFMHYLNGNHLEKPPIIFYLRSKAVAAINESLDDPTQQLHDSGVLAIVLMAFVESLGGDLVAYDIHMTGLSRMLKIRGGVKTLPLNGLCASVLVWLDVNHARIHGSSLYLTESVEVTKRLSLPSSLGSSSSSSNLAALDTSPVQGNQFREVTDVQLLTWPRLIQWMGQSADTKISGHKWNFVAVCAESVFHFIAQVVEQFDVKLGRLE